MCAQCEKIFDGRRHFERKGLAYCETDYSEVSRYQPVTDNYNCFACSYLVTSVSAVTSHVRVTVSGSHVTTVHF